MVLDMMLMMTCSLNGTDDDRLPYCTLFDMLWHGVKGIVSICQFRHMPLALV